jgi:hypothetical protein
MAEKEKPMILSFNTVWVVVVFIFSLGLLHANVTNGVKENTDGIEELKHRINADSASIHVEIKSLNKGQDETNRQNAQMKNDVEWIKKGQQEIKELIKKSK